jgi:hypothetical protein
LNDASALSQYRFAITYSEDEILAIRKLMAARYARGHDHFTFWGLLLASPMVIGLVVFGAFKLGLIAPSALQAVLFTAYVAFFAGAMGYYLMMRRAYRKFSRDEGRRRLWNYSLDDTDVRYDCETVGVRVAWRAIDAVEDLGKMVLFRFGPQVICIPSRVFPDSTVRAAFVAAAREHVKAAAQST